MMTKDKKIKDGKYAEIVNEIAEHIYRDNIKTTQRRAKVLFPDGNKREIDLLVKLKNGEEIVFEVRDRKGNQGVDWVDQVIGKPRERIDTMLVTNGKIHNELVEVLKGESVC